MEYAEKKTNRQLKALQTKRTIYESAISLFKEKGYEHVSIDEITEEASTSKGSFYTYFCSKDDVVLEYYKQMDEHYMDLINSKDFNGNTLDKLLHVNNVGLRYSEEIGVEFQKIVLKNQLSQEQDIPYVVSEKRPIYQIIKSILVEGQQKGEVRTDLSVDELVSMIMCFYRGIYLDWCLLEKEFTLPKKGTQFIRVLLEGIIR